MSEEDFSDLEGKSLWQVAKMTGKDRIFETPDELWHQCVRYFKWVELNGLKEEKLFNGKEKVRRDEVTHMRAMTICGLTVFIGISERAWRDWRNPNSKSYREDLAPIVTRAEKIIREQKFSGAAGGMLNPLIIARDLGLSDKTEITTPEGGASEPVNSGMTTEEKAAAFKDMLEHSKGGNS